MKTIDVPIALGALAALSACQLPAAPLPNPNQHEASKAIGRVLRAGDVAAWSIPEGQPTNCVPGTMDNTEVRSCKVCASIVYIEHDWTGSQAVAKREIFDIAFKRALSFDQPDIAPSDSKSGVWVAVIPPSSPYTLPQVSRLLLDQQNISSQAVAGYTGYAIDGYYIGTRAPIWSMNGRRVDDDSVYSALLNTNILAGSEVSSLKPCP